MEALWCPINPADLVNMEGAYGASRPDLPLVPGSEGVGRVTAIGSGVDHLRVGDLVLLPGPGTWQERVKVAAARLVALPAVAHAARAARAGKVLLSFAGA